MSAQRCVVCGKDPAEGWAKINGRRYCHPDEGVSCYGGGLASSNVELVDKSMAGLQMTDPSAGAGGTVAES